MTKIPEQRMTLSMLAEKFLMVKEAQHCGEKTLHDYRVQVRKFVEQSRNLVEYDALEQDVLRYFAAIPDTSPARYNKPFQNVNAFLNWLVEQEYLVKNPMTANKMRKRRDDGNVKPVELNDLRLFTDVIDKTTYCGLRDFTIVMVMLDTGIRTSEILGLQNEDFSPYDNSVVIGKTLAKTRTRRVVYLSASTARYVEEFMRCKPKEWENWLFPNYEGRQLKVQHLDKAFIKYSRLSGLKITPYQLRHSFATLFVKNGGDLFSLQRMMGHADLRMTKRYAEIDEDFVRSQHAEFSPARSLMQGRKRKL
jgi:site-specific recombinase XerD